MYVLYGQKNSPSTERAISVVLLQRYLRSHSTSVAEPPFSSMR
jgi:hypothetical protein